MAGIRFYHEFQFEYEMVETVSPLIRRIVARNPGAFTGPGTSTYVIGHGRVALIDPGPALDEHVEAILHALRGETIENILITHTHSDHWSAAAAIQSVSGAAMNGFAMDPSLQDGDEIAGPGWHLTAVHTPGHTSDHLCFSLAEGSVLFTGDHVMGWSTSVIIPPDGDMAAYMRSLEKLLVRDDIIYFPGHGTAIPDPKPHVRSFIEHRQERSRAILRRLEAGDAAIPEIVDAVYKELSPGRRGAAGLSVLAHLIELISLSQVEINSAAGPDRRYRLTARHKGSGHKGS